MSAADNLKLEAGWKAALHDQFAQPYMAELSEFLRQEKAAGKQIYPPGPLMFSASAGQRPCRDCAIG